MNDIADADFLELVVARQCGEGIDFGRLFADHAVEFDQQRAFADRQPGIGAPGEQAEQHDEEQQQEDQRERIFDPDEQVPHLARKAGPRFGLVVAGERAAHRDCPGAGGIVRGGGGGFSHDANLGTRLALGNARFDRRVTQPYRRHQSQPSRRYQRTVSARASSVPRSGRHSAAGGCAPAVATQSGCAI